MRLEKRLAPRRNTMIESTIVFNGGRTQLEGASVSKVPTPFDLIAPGHRPHACRVVWRALKELGVQFQS